MDSRGENFDKTEKKRKKKSKVAAFQSTFGWKNMKQRHQMFLSRSVDGVSAPPMM